MKTQSSIVVKKFGGTSVGSIARIENVASRIKEDVENGQSPVVVSSAMSGETNRLIGLAGEIDSKYRGEAYDMLLASGEQVSISLLAIALEKRGLKAEPLLAYQLGIKTDSIFSKARILSVDHEKIKQIISEGKIPIVAGFQGINQTSKITTLGRGGSDTTAVAIAAAIKADSCEIYTDVPAVFSADPRLVKKAREIPTLRYDEMMEMASLGSKVLHFRCVELAAKYKIKIHLRSTFEKREGTFIVPEEEAMENPVVSAVTHEALTAVIKLFPVPKGSGFLADLFGKLSEASVVVDIITQSHNEEGQRLAFSLPMSDLELARDVISKAYGDKVSITVMEDKAKISIVGVGMRNYSGVAYRFFNVLSKNNIDIDLVTTSDIKVSAIIDKESLSDAANQLHTEFGLDAT